MLIKQVHISNLLSFGPKTERVDLGALNVLIGPNGSGKSNFLEALSLLQAAPSKITDPIRDGGGIRDWLYKSAKKSTKEDARIEVVTSNGDFPKGFHYGLAFHEVGNRFELSDEFLENEFKDAGKQAPYFYYKWNEGRPVINTKTWGERKLTRESLKPDQSILAQKRDDDVYPELTWLADQFQAMRFFREWTFGRYAAPRLPQKTNQPSDRLELDSSNLGLVLNRLRLNASARKNLINALRVIYDGIEDFHIDITEGGAAQIFLIESGGSIPATRLSDGTLRYLSMLALLCDPAPPPFIAIEEPELGLHPDMLPSLARLLHEASERTQLVVTTHAPGLIDALSDIPESVFVCERDQDGTRLERLEAKQMAPWLEKFRLGELWTRGEIGGTRW